MKKFLALLLASIMMMSTAACGSSSGNETATAEKQKALNLLKKVQKAPKNIPVLLVKLPSVLGDLPLKLIVTRKLVMLLWLLIPVQP